jgi:hypothetical protein
MWAAWDLTIEVGKRRMKRMISSWLRKQPTTGLGKTGQFYVYRLRYPNNPEVFGYLSGSVFYVGKGTKDRVSAHEKQARAILKRGNLMKLSHKHKVIITIWDTGHNVVQEIVGRTDDETVAYEAETEYINYEGLARLTNETYGHRPKPKPKTIFAPPAKTTRTPRPRR